MFLTSDGSSWLPLVHNEDISRAFCVLMEADRADVHVLEYGEAGADIVNIALLALVDPAMLDAYLAVTLPAVHR